MTAAPSLPPERLLPAVRFWLMRTPLTVLAIYCLLSLYLRENYPFTHYPMYSNPSAERSYYVVADAATGEPLPIAELTGITCPKIGKIWRTKAAELAGKLKTSKTELSHSEGGDQTIGLAIFSQLRGYAKDRNQTLPARLQLRRMEISYADGKVVETPDILATE
jgi:hypothetical protein